MSTIKLRQTTPASTGATNVNRTLTMTEVDQNFDNLNLTKLEASNNLSDVTNTATARTNLGVTDSTLTLNVGAAGATNTSVTVSTGTGFSANAASNATYQLAIGPSLTNLASMMTGATTGFLKKTAADTYTLDANTYLTSQNNDFGTFAIAADSGYTWGTANANTNQVADGIGDTLTIVRGLTGTGNTAGIDLYTSTVAGTDAIKIAHADTSTLTGQQGTAGVASITVDEMGHVTAVGTATYLTSYTESDTLQTVTSRGASSNVATITLSATTATTSSGTGTLVVAGGVGIGGDLRLGGNLYVDGTTTTINSTTLTVDDKNIELGSIGAPTDITADGGGITLKGTTDKTFNWSSSTSAWTSSEHLNIATGKEYEINGTSVLNSTTLGSGVINSSLTKVGLTSAGFVKTDASGYLSVDSSTYASSAHTHYIGTTQVQSTSANQNITGILSSTFPGSTSGTIKLIPTAVAGTNTTITMPATTGTMALTSDIGNGQFTVSTGTGLTGGAILGTANQSGNTSVTISHADTSTQASVNNANGTVIQDVTLDDFGHVTGLASVDLDARYFKLERFPSGSTWRANYTNAVYDSTNNLFKKSAATAAWDAQVYSTDGVPTNVFCEVRLAGPVGSTAFGLNTYAGGATDTDAAYTAIDYCFLVSNTDASITIYESGTSVLTGIGTATLNTIFTITYDGTNVKYYVDGILKRTVARTVSNFLYFDSSIYTQNAGFYARFGHLAESILSPWAGYGHTHNYAGSSSAGGAANSVANNQTLKFDTGTTEGTDLYTFNGSAAKTVDIKAGTNVTLTKAAGSITIGSTDTNTTYSVKASSQTGGAGLDLDAGGSGSGTDTVTFKGSGATSVAYTDANTITISSTDNNTTYDQASTTYLGLVKLGSDTTQTVAANAVTTTASRSYAVQLNSSGQMLVNVPWVDTDTNTTYSAGTGLTLSTTTFSVNYGTSATTACVGNDSRLSDTRNTTNSMVLKFDTGTTEGTNLYTFNGSAAKTIDIKAGTNVTLTKAAGSITISSTDTNTTYSAGTGLSLSGTTFNHSNSITAGSVSEGGAARTLAFGGTFNVPSVTYDAQGHVTATGSVTLTMPANPDTNYYPTSFGWTAGTTSGPTGSLSGTGMSAVSFAAIPSASGTASGIMTTGAQTIAGAKTFSSDLTSSGNVIAYSDRRLKTDLKVIDNALEKVGKLNGYTYTRVDTGVKQTGLVAQELQEVLPEAVVEQEYLSIAYGNVVGLLVESIKELKALVDSQRATIEELSKKIDSIGE